MSRNFTLSSDVPSEGKKESLTIAILGAKSVGKSTVSCRLLKNWTELTNKPRRKEKKKQGKFNVVGRDLNVHLVDTSKLSADLELPECDAFLLVYSMVDDDSFQSACDAREQILQAAADVPIIFVANKTDIAGSVEVMARCSRHFNVTERLNHSHCEISAETDLSAKGLLEEILIQSSVRSLELDRIDTNVHECPLQKKVATKSSTVTDYKKIISIKKRWIRSCKLLRIFKRKDRI